VGRRRWAFRYSESVLGPGPLRHGGGAVPLGQPRQIVLKPHGLYLNLTHSYALDHRLPAHFDLPVPGASPISLFLRIPRGTSSQLFAVLASPRDSIIHHNGSLYIVRAKTKAEK
jgi:hypothetical protein